MIINTNTQIDLSPIVQRTLESYYNSRIEKIGMGAFCKCSKLTTVNFPNVTNIGSSAFASCTSLRTISFPAATSVYTYAFVSCYSLTIASFPNATSIAAYAFQYCSSLTTASFPKTSYIGNYTFRSCIRLTKLYLNSTAVVSLGGSSVFYSTPIGGYSTTAGTYGSVYVPTSLVNSYKTATYWSSIADRIVGI